MLKKIRVGVSVIIFCLISFYFLDFADLLPRRFHLLTELQLIPALISFNAIALIIIFSLTILFGRVYCSSICPMGVFQDVVDWIAKKFHRKKIYPRLKERKVLRWSIVVLTTVAFFSGFLIVVSILDPYSAFGRFATTIVKPVYLEGNNIIARISNYYENYRFYKVDVLVTSITALVIAAITMLIVGYLSYKWGRLYCNTVCPVGTILGFVSRFSVFKIRINHEKCNGCSLCSMKCKSSCIDAAAKTIDYSRCVDCFNCLEACNRKAMSFAWAFAKKKVPVIESHKETTNSPRRKFFAFLILGITAAKNLFGKNPDDSTKAPKEIYTSHNVPFKRKHPVTPPGAVDVKRFNNRCTACHLCVSKCPSNVLTPTFLEYGLEGMLQPAMEFQHGYCNYKCTICTEVCPNDALKKITEKQKKTLQVGHVHFIKENCVTVTDGTDCGACSEHCPTQAVSMQPYKGDLRIPVIDQDLCVGCGGCEYICPTRPYRAIYVVGNPVHKQAKIPEEKEQKKIEVKDFGF
jgi:ferredoxin